MREAQFNRPVTIAFKQKVFELIKCITDEQKISIAQWVREAAEKRLEDEGGGS